MSTTEAILEKVKALPAHEQEEVLRFASSLAEKSPAIKKGDPYSGLHKFANLKLDGPADASTRYHEYLYGGNALDGNP